MSDVEKMTDRTKVHRVVQQAAQARRFKDKVTVVTGGGSGIGRATAQRFGLEGGRVACVDIDPAAAEETVKNIASEGGEAAAVHCDVSEAEEVRLAFEMIEHDFGQPIDVLFANAGIEGPLGFAPDISIDDWERVLAVNLTAQFLSCRQAILSMKRAGGGAIVITGSNSSLVGYPRWLAYTAAKGGVLLLAKNLALDHAPDNIRVNCVCPGPVDTPLFRRGHERSLGTPKEVEELLARRGRVGHPEEVANAIAFLASDEASYITGASLAVDYGNTARGGPTWPSSRYWD